MRNPIQGVHHRENGSSDLPEGPPSRRARATKPRTLFITCSDLPVDPHRLTRSGPGELYVVSNAGNVVPPHGAEKDGQAATVEAGVTGLGVRDVIVCGHSPCLVMRGLLQPELLSSLPAVTGWLRHADATRRRIVTDRHGQLEEGRGLFAAVAENVLVQLENLRTLPAVASRLATDDLKLHGWVYEAGTGEVFIYDATAGRFFLTAGPEPKTIELRDVPRER